MRFEADFCDEVGEEFIEDTFGGVEAWLGVSVCEKEVLDCRSSQN